MSQERHTQRSVALGGAVAAELQGTGDDGLEAMCAGNCLAIVGAATQSSVRKLMAVYANAAACCCLIESREPKWPLLS